MNKDLLQLIQDYATKEHSEISVNLIGKSKDSLVAMLLDLLTKYYNDLNSSTMRELVVAVVAGYEPSSEKLGYNGFRHNTLTGKTEQCEIKPRNFRTDSKAKKPKKLNGGGNFTDYTWARFQKHQQEKPNMLVAGFVNGRLIYIFGFSFNEQSFISRLQEQLEHHFSAGDSKGVYQRSAEFSFKHYKDVESLEIIYSVSKRELNEAKPYITGPVFKYLENNIE
ncbi:hypothetical protein F4X73_06680 [Candidatus Poribacteria bacterium]|nr:hypothetical protein [Candidatus Poribacteria bacterium]